MEQKVTVTEVIKEFPTLYGIRRLTTAFRRVRRWNLSRASFIQPAQSRPVALVSILILSSHLRLSPTKFF
jgi:hypothetical protein